MTVIEPATSASTIRVSSTARRLASPSSTTGQPALAYAPTRHQPPGFSWFTPALICYLKIWSLSGLRDFSSSATGCSSIPAVGMPGHRGTGSRPGPGRCRGWPPTRSECHDQESPQPTRSLQAGRGRGRGPRESCPRPVLRPAGSECTGWALAAIGVGNRGGGNVWQDFVTTQDDVRIVAACDCFASRGATTRPRRERPDPPGCRDLRAHGPLGARSWPGCIPRRRRIQHASSSARPRWLISPFLAGKDMSTSDNPRGVAMAWAWKLRDAAARRKIVFQYGTQQRSSGEFIRAVEIGHTAPKANQDTTPGVEDLSIAWRDAEAPPRFPGCSSPCPSLQGLDHEIRRPGPDEAVHEGRAAPSGALTTSATTPSAHRRLGRPPARHRPVGPDRDGRSGPLRRVGRSRPEASSTWSRVGHRAATPTG